MILYYSIGIVVIITLAWCAYKIKLVSMNQIKNWLLWAVLEAEKNFGNGTGVLKLRYVYDLFICRFSLLSRLISFEYFSSLVDMSLCEMKTILLHNNKIKNYIEIS